MVHDQHMSRGREQSHKNRLKYERELRGWSQAKVAEKVGTTPSTVSVWERGRASPSAHFREQLCLLFGKNAYELGLLEGANENTHEGTHSNTLTMRSEDGLYDPMIPLPLTTKLVGRDNDIEQIKSQLIGEDWVALMALNGLPGVGKTALTLELIHDHDVRASFRDGVLWAGLGPHANIISTLSHWGRLLGMTATEIALLEDKRAWAVALRRSIGTRQMLLVIDDVWSVEDAFDLAIGGKNCTHLITTRFPSIALRTAEARTFVVRELNEENSVQLLTHFVPDSIANESAMIQALAHSVGGLPLALILVGKYIWMEAQSGQPRRVRNAFERLQSVEARFHLTEAQPVLERPPNLEPTTPWSLLSTIAVSDEQITEQGRTALRALSVFPAKPNSFSEEAAVAVCALSVEVLDHLVDAGLLENAGTGRYSLHQTIADYARMQMTEMALAHTYKRMVEYIIRYVETYKTEYEVLEQESTLILRALDVAFERAMHAEFILGILAFTHFLQVRGLYALAETHLQKAYTMILVLEDKAHTIEVLSSLGQILLKQEKYVQAETSLQEGLTLARQLQHMEYISDVLLTLGKVASKQEKHVQAEAYLQEGLTLARQREDRERICILLSSLGAMAGRRGDYAQAEMYLQEALSIARQLGLQDRTCVILSNLGAVAVPRGDFTRAETYLQEGLAIARRIGHREYMTHLLANLSGIAEEQGDYAQAETYLQEGLAIARELQSHSLIGFLLMQLGVVAEKQEQYPQAEQYLQEALTVASEMNIHSLRSNVSQTWGEMYFKQQKFEAAATAFREALKFVPEKNQYLKALAYYGLARASAAQGNILEALHLGETSLVLFEETNPSKAIEVRNWLEEMTSLREVL